MFLKYQCWAICWKIGRCVVVSRQCGCNQPLFLLRCPDRIIESLRLEKSSKIIKSTCQPNTTMPAKTAEASLAENTKLYPKSTPQPHTTVGIISGVVSPHEHPAWGYCLQHWWLETEEDTRMQHLTSVRDKPQGCQKTNHARQTWWLLFHCVAELFQFCGFFSGKVNLFQALYSEGQNTKCSGQGFSVLEWSDKLREEKQKIGQKKVWRDLFLAKE